MNTYNLNYQNLINDVRKPQEHLRYLLQVRFHNIEIRGIVGRKFCQERFCSTFKNIVLSQFIRFHIGIPKVSEILPTEFDA